MAANFSINVGEQLTNRKGHDMTWSCDTSGDPIKFLCEEHNVPLCHPCATKDHQKPCSLKHIGDVILDRRKHLEQKMKELEKAMPGFERVDELIKSCKSLLAKQLQSVNGEADLAYENKMKSIAEAERDEIHTIHEEAEEEMRLIIEKRDKRIKARQEITGQERKVIEDTRKKLTSECNQIDQLMRKQISALETKNRLAIDKLKSINQKMKEIRKTDKELVNGAPNTIASVDETLSVNITQESVECLQKIHRDIESVEFVECTRHGQRHYGRIHEDIGKWEKVKEIALQEYPRVVGLINDEEVCVFSRLQRQNASITYAIDIINGNSEQVIEEYLFSCAPLDSKWIVCGKDNAHITLYDRTHKPWKEVWDIGLPYNRGSLLYRVLMTIISYVDVDSDGMILARARGESDIYVINPADGKILRTITIQGKEIGWGLRSLPSGNIMVDTFNGTFIISRSGDIVSKVSSSSQSDVHQLVTSSGYKVDVDMEKQTLEVYRRDLGV